MAENSQQHNNHSNGGSPVNHQNHEVSDNSAALLPQLESLERMMKFPVVEAAWHQGQDVYGKVKGKSKQLFYYNI